MGFVINVIKHVKWLLDSGDDVLSGIYSVLVQNTFLYIILTNLVCVSACVARER